MLGMNWNYHFFSKEGFLLGKFLQRLDGFTLIWRKISLIARTVCRCNRTQYTAHSVEISEIYSHAFFGKNFVKVTI